MVEVSDLNKKIQSYIPKWYGKNKDKIITVKFTVEEMCCLTANMSVHQHFLESKKIT